MDENNLGGRFEPGTETPNYGAQPVPPDIARPSVPTKPWGGLANTIRQKLAGDKLRRLTSRVTRTAVALAIGGLLIGGAAGFAIGHSAGSAGVGTSSGADATPGDQDPGRMPGGGFGPGHPGGGDDQAPPWAAGSDSTGSLS